MRYICTDLTVYSFENNNNTDAKKKGKIRLDLGAFLFRDIR